MWRLLLVFALLTAAQLGPSGQPASGASAIGVHAAHEGTILLGKRNTMPAPATAAAGRVYAFRFVALRSGTARSVHLYVGRSNHARRIVVAIYANAGDRPGILRASGSVAPPAGAGWDVVSVGPAHIQRGKAYWLAVLAQQGPLAYRGEHTPGCRRAMISRTGMSRPPTRWSGHGHIDGCSLSAFVSTLPAHGGAVGSPTGPVGGPGGTGGGGSSGGGGSGGPVTVPPGGCFASPGACGYPDPSYHNVGATTPCSSLPAVGSITASSPGQTIANVRVVGTITIDAPNVTVDDVCVIDNAASAINSGAVRLEHGATNTVIEHATIGGANGTSQSVEQAITNISGSSATARYDYLSNCGECVWGGPWAVSDSYVITNGMQGTSDHLEDVYCSDSSATLTHDTLLNPADQTATIFCDTNGGGGGPCDNHISITGSLIAGGGFVIYTCGNAASVGSSTMTISDNRFARCTTSPIKYNPGTGGRACQGSTGSSIGSGADSQGFWPYGGYFGVTDSVYCPPTSGQAWSGNVWDDDGAAVGC